MWNFCSWGRYIYEKKKNQRRQILKKGLASEKLVLMETIVQKKDGKKKNRRNTLYESVINNRTTQSLRKQEQEFAELHRDDSDKTLLEYVLREALKLGHTPGEKEIVGWSYLIARFGSWNDVLEKTSLSKYKSDFPVCTNTLRLAETERQKELYRERKREKKIKAQQWLKQQRERSEKSNNQ